MDREINVKKMLSVVAPTYNESLGILEFHNELINCLNQIQDFNYEVIYVDDGSNDNTYEKLIDIKNSSISKIKVVKLSRNFGHQAAVLCGIRLAKGDVVITIDSDLQDPPNLIKELIVQHQKGFHIVLAKRKKRNGEKIGKIYSAKIYYMLADWLADLKMPRDVGDFRLMSRSATNAMIELKDSDPYLRGQVAWIGFSRTEVEYDRSNRNLGTSNYTLRKMLQLGFNGVAGFSGKPLSFPFYISIALTTITTPWALFLVINKIFNPTSSIPGFTTLLLVTLILSSIQLLSIGILGKYLYTTLTQTRSRPDYFIEELAE
jgi:glycosyltransferase involved in cell wall biosynthesis